MLENMAQHTKKQLQTDMADLSIENQIQALIEADKLNAFLFAWVSKAKSPLSFRSLDMAVTLLSRQHGHRLDDLETDKSQLTEEYIQNLSTKDNTPVFKIVRDQVHFESSTIEDFFVKKSPLDELELWHGEDLEFLLAKVCVTYISLEEFRDLPLPVRVKGRRSDLENSNPFLTYASFHWHQHIHSSEDARRLEPFLDQIIGPGYNTVYLWIDQSSNFSGNGPRIFIRSRQQVAIMRDIPWLALYLLELTDSEPEDLFPARDLVTITNEAPRVLQALVRRKPDYYLSGITKSVLVQAAYQYHDALETLREILSRCDKLQFPATFLQAVADNKKGEKILEYLFTKWDVPITYGLLATAAGNNLSAGYAILRLCFDRHPDIRVSEDMVNAAITSSNSDNLRLLFEHDPEAPVGDSQLEKLVKRNIDVEKLKIVYDVKGETLVIPVNVVESAIKLNRTKIVYWIFETYGGIEITERVLCAAAGSQTHSTALAEYLFDKCDRSLISSEVLHAAITRWNSADKMTTLVLRYGRDLVVSDELLLASSSDWNGKILDILLEHQRRQEVPKKLVHDAIRSFKAKLSWKHMVKSDILDNSLLNTLKKRVPNDPYLQKKLAETDFTVPTEDKGSEDMQKQTAVPDAAKESNLDALKVLLDEGMDVNARNGSTCTCDQNHGLGTALQRATQQRNLEMVKFLLERGADPNIQEGDYGNPLQEAAMASDLDIVKVLVEHNAEINLSGGQYASPLIAAARANDAKIVRYLLDKGGDINMTDNDNDAWSPCLYAIAYESHDVLRFLSCHHKAMPALGELIASPPSKFVKIQPSNKRHMHFHRNSETPVEISDDGLIISMSKFFSSLFCVSCLTREVKEKESSRSVVVAGDHPIIPTQPFYFEIEIDHAVDAR